MGRLLNTGSGEVQSDRRAATLRAAEATGKVVVLKGAGTLVAAAGRPLTVNMTGNPGMASGGMGDVLAGMLLGLAGQGLDLFDAACLGVYVHGRAGDNAALAGSQAGLVAGDVIEELPAAFGELAPR
jgi:NAD(P)H-hydrate epimerase